MIKTKTKKLLAIFTAIVLALSIFLIWQNNSIVITKIEITNEKIPDNFSGYKIVQISDLHNKKFGKNQSILLNKIENLNPDIIVITGDLIDKSKTNIPVAMQFINSAVKILPTYYVNGNHEMLSGNYNVLYQQLISAGVTVLENQKIEIIKEQQKIEILGVQDPTFSETYNSDSVVMDNILMPLVDTNNNTYKILLSHRPELFDVYEKYNIDLVFSGHAHGGQIRLPFIGGLFAPNQGLLPEYTAGKYNKNNTTMIVSRGLGNSIFPFRVFNRPEIIFVTLNN